MTRKFETLITRQEYLRFLETPDGQGIPKPDWWRPPPLEALPPAPIPPRFMFPIGSRKTCSGDSQTDTRRVYVSHRE